MIRKVSDPARRPACSRRSACSIPTSSIISRRTRRPACASSIRRSIDAVLRAARRRGESDSLRQDGFDAEQIEIVAQRQPALSGPVLRARSAGAGRPARPGRARRDRGGFWRRARAHLRPPRRFRRAGRAGDAQRSSAAAFRTSSRAALAAQRRVCRRDSRSQNAVAASLFRTGARLARRRASSTARDLRQRAPRPLHRRGIRFDLRRSAWLDGASRSLRQRRYRADCAPTGFRGLTNGWPPRAARSTERHAL